MIAVMAVMENPLQAKEQWLVWFLCALAAVHVLVFSAAFPFFNNVDEPYHFDLVVKYSHLHFPQGQEYIADESLQYTVVYGTWEYLYPSDSLSAPTWKQSMSQIEPILVAREKRWRLPNYESPQPPLYYLLAGAWWKLWAAFGFHDYLLLYLVRFLNAIFVGILVWTGWVAARQIFPDSAFVRIGVSAFWLLCRKAFSTQSIMMSFLRFALVGHSFAC